MLQKKLLYCMVVCGFFFTNVEKSIGQSTFRVGAWCFLQAGQTPPIYQINPPTGPWRVKTDERDKLLNLGLNYFIACTNVNAEDALVFMGDSLDSAPAPKSFKSTLEWVPITPPLFPQAYQLWKMSQNAQRYNIQSWNDSVTVGFQAIYNRHSARIDGVHSLLALAEGCTNQFRKMAGINYMCNNTIVDSYVQPWYVPTPFTPFACDSVITYEVAKRLVNADHFMGGGYYLKTGTPTSGAAFQTALQGFVSSLRDPAMGIRDAASNTKLWAVLQTQQAPLPIDLRLPSKEEILCFVNLGLAQGARGIVYYVYSTAGSESGLLDVNRNITAQYNNVKDINTNYQGTGQSLATIGGNFLNLTWKEDFSIHQNTTEPISSTYKLYDVTAKIPGGATDAETDTYVEVGILQNAGNVNHYMVINRRCTSSETREVTIKFQTTTNNAYRITDVFTNTPTIYYPANTTELAHTITLGPGQGKLLKLEDLGNWTGTISSNTTWSGTIIGNNNITVNNGVTLTISAGTNVKFISAKKLIINGSLQALGTSPQPIIFDRSGTSGTWNGINFGPTGSGNVNYATIDHATKGVKIDVTNNVTLDHCTIKNFTEQGVYLNASGATVQYCTIKDAPTAAQGIYSSGNNANPTIANNTIFNMPIGITRQGNPAAAQIRDNDIHTCTNAGVQTVNSQPEIYKNKIHGSLYGIRLLQSGSAPNIHDNDLYGNTTGLYLEQSQPSNLKWNNFGYICGSGTNYNTNLGMLVNYVTSGNSFMASKWNNFYDGNSGSAADIQNITTTTLVATGQYWNNQVISFYINASSPQSSSNANAGPCGSTGKESVSDEAITQNPLSFELVQNFPNPFNPATKIRFNLPEKAFVSLAIYDLNGRLVRQLFSQQPFENGWGEGNWDGRNDQGLQVVSGVYLYRLQAQAFESNASFTQTRRLVVMQ